MMNLESRRTSKRLRTCLAVAACVAGIVTPSWATSVPVAGPVFVPEGTFDAREQSFLFQGRSLTDSGIALAYSGARIYQHNSIPGKRWGRGVRWDSRNGSGSVLEGLGTAADHRETQQPVEISSGGTAAGDVEKYDAGGAPLGTHAVRWDSGGHVTELAPLGVSATGTFNSAVTGINRSDTIIGRAEMYSSGVYTTTRAVRWDAPSADPVPLNGSGGEFTPGQPWAIASDINDSGTIVGSEAYIVNGVNQGHALLWNPGRRDPVILGIGTISPVGMDTLGASHITNSGFVVGRYDRRSAENKSLGTRAVRWNPSGTATDLQPLGFRSDGYTIIDVADVNELGTAVGKSNYYINGIVRGTRAVRWDAATTIPEKLDALYESSTGYGSSAAYAVNNLGAVAGFSSTATTSSTAVVWLANSTAALKLESLLFANSGWTLDEARAISDTGFVSGTGSFDPDGAGPAASDNRLFTLLVPQAGTYGRGDGNFDTKTDFDDLVLLAQKYNLPNASLKIDVADFNLDGITDFNDLVTLAQNYGTGVANLSGFDEEFAADWTLAQSFVPEPTAVMRLLASASIATRRRRP